MGLDTDLFSVINNPIDKLVKDASSNLVDTAENTIIGELSGAFHRIGLGNGTNKNLLGNLGEQVLAGIGQEIFGAIGKEMNLMSKSDIEDYRGVLTDPDSKQRDQIMESQVSKIGKTRDVETLVFPPDLNDFYVQLDFKEYRRPAPAVPADVSTVFSIALPLPRTLEDRHDISYNSDVELGFIGTIVNQGQNGVEWDGSYLAMAGKELLRATFPDKPELISLISQATGATFNNHVSVMFNQPSLRRHSMSWMLAPNNAAESELIRKITKKLRGAALPAFSRELDGSANINILQFPMMCKITLMPWGDVGALSRKAKDIDKSYNGNMYTFKHCVIESIKVNYAPSNPAFFSDEGNAPAFVAIEMSFLELEYFTADDFGREGTNTDFGKAVGQQWNDIFTGTPEEQQAKYANTVGLDAAANSTPAQATTTNNFNANSTVVRAFTPEDTNDPQTSEKLYQTADGSWYHLEVIGGKDTIRAVDSLSDPVFEKFQVYEPSIADAPTDPVLWSSGNTVLIQTGAGGQLQMGSG